MDMCSEISWGSAIRRHGTWEELERMEDQGCWVGKEGGQGEGGREGLGKVQWHWVYRSVFLIVNLGHQGSYGSFGTRLGMRDTEVP